MPIPTANTSGEAFYSVATEAGDPATVAASVAPSDTVALPFVSTAVWIGGAGNLSVAMSNNSGVPAWPTPAALTVATTFSNCAAGQWMPLRVSQVFNTNTTATGIVVVRR